MKVLVLERDTKERSLIQQALERGGHEFISAENSDQAWTMIEGGETRFIIADWDTADIRKAELIPRARAAKMLGHIYFLLLTAKRKEEDLTEFGADDYLHKPLSISELKTRILIGERILSLGDHLAQARDQLESLAMYDSLTGVMNHSAFYKLAQGEMERARRASAPLSLIALDIDNFKALNEKHGIETGDEVLRLVSQTIREKSRPYDCIGRWTGDEFVIALPGVIGADAEKIADRIIKGIRAVHLSFENGPALNVMLSAGIASASRISAAAEVEALIQQARQAMARAKEAGGDQVYLAYV